ncbi:MAG: hypothetical protein LWX11_10410 [Firmicutes bacterium]|nr:hypothetical protein [Bacillota bacterium]
MNRALRASTLRFGGGLLLLLSALIIAYVLLPDASQKRARQEKAYAEAQKRLEAQEAELTELKAKAEELRLGQKRMEEVLADLPQESEGQLKWKLSRALYDLSAKHGVRVLTVKYGAPSRAGAKGTDLESIDVEFVGVGIYPNLKTFMLGLEGSKLPFGLANARLEESPEGGRITVTLRAFRRTGIVKADGAEEA